MPLRTASGLLVSTLVLLKSGAALVARYASCEVRLRRRLVRGGDPLPQQLRDVDVGENRHQRGDHDGDGQNEFSFPTHCAYQCGQFHKLSLSEIQGCFTRSDLLFTRRFFLLCRIASAAALPYSLSLLCNVFRLIPRISAALVLLLFVDSSVLIISCFSASPTVVPTPR